MGSEGEGLRRQLVNAVLGMKSHWSGKPGACSVNQYLAIFLFHQKSCFTPQSRVFLVFLGGVFFLFFFFVFMTWYLRNFFCVSWNQLHAILTWLSYYDRKFIYFFLSFKWDLQNEKVFQHMSICLHHQCWWLQCSTHQTQVCVNMKHGIIFSETISEELLSNAIRKVLMMGKICVIIQNRM